MNLRSSRDDEVKRESLILSRFEVSLQESVECQMSQKLDRFHDESEVFGVGRKSLREKIGIGTYWQSHGRPGPVWRFRMNAISILFCFVWFKLAG